MKTHLKLLIVALIVVSFTGCTIAIIDKPEVGMTFNSENHADITESGANTGDQHSFYQLVGQVDGGYLYKKNPYWIDTPDTFKGGIVVSNKKIIKVISSTDLKKYIADAEQRKSDLELKRKKEQQELAEKEIIKENLKKQREYEIEKARINAIKSRKYSIFPASFTVNKLGRNFIHVISRDDSPFILERVVANNRTGNNECDKSGLVEYIQTGDVVSFQFDYTCGALLTKVDVYTNRGTKSFSFKD